MINIQKNFSLKNKNTLGIECIAEYFYEIKEENELLELISFANEYNLDINILGLGSNVLLPSLGLKGVTIILKNQKFERNNDLVVLGAGNILSATILQLAKENYDLFHLAGYPSTIGGAVTGNAGTQGVGIGDFLESAIVFDLKTEKKEIWNKEDFKFTYRHSELKNKRNKIFWEGKFSFPKGENVLEKITSFIKERSQKQPKGKSSGCFFKNPLNDKNNPNKYSAGYLIEQCGLKGTQIGDAKISEIHANFFINVGNASSEDFLRLIKLAKEKVKVKFDIELELEVRVIN